MGGSEFNWRLMRSTKKFLLATTFGCLMFAPSMFANTCAADLAVTGTLQNLISDTSCTVAFTNMTLTFSNFSLSGTSDVITASDDGGGSLINGGFTFTDQTSTSGLVPGTVIGYTVSITTCNAGWTCTLTGYNDQGNFPFISGTNTGQLVFTYTYNPNTGQTPTSTTLNQSNTTLNNNTLYVQGISPDTVSASVAYSLTGSAGEATQITDDVYISNTYNATVPEPTTFVLMGAGLGLVGLLRRRKSARR